MAFQNIGASNKDDAFYRYKMPKMITKIEGRGNGIKTNIVNMVDIAKALARPAAYTTKFFGCELGAQSKFDERTGVSIVNGAHDTPKLSQLLENFIKKYVQCYGCGNPETEVIITKNQMITLNCAACGYVSDVDMRDKLTTFILKNPPEQKKASKDKKAMRRAEKERLKEGEAADEEQRKLKKEVKKKPVSSSKEGASSKTSATKKKAAVGSDEDQSSPIHSHVDEVEVADDDNGVQWLTDASAEAAQKRFQDQLTPVTAGMVMLSTNDRSHQHEKTDLKKESATNGIKEPDKRTELPHLARHDALAKQVKANLEKGCSPTELRTYLDSVSASPQEVMKALFGALFEGVGKGFAKEVGKRLKYLSAVVQDEGSQMLLLQALEDFCAKVSPDAVKEVALALKNLYDADVLDEEPVVQWYKNNASGDGKNSQIWKNVKPFVEWVQNAESESE